MGLEDKFLTTKVDKGGPIAKDRLDFQVNCAILLVVNTYKNSSDDFVVYLDHFDDIAIHNKTTDKISCYQVKTKDGEQHWTENVLSKKEFFPKMYKHLDDFENGVQSLYFLSNAKFKVNKQTKEKSPLKDFSEDNRKIISEAIKTRYPGKDINEKFFDITELSKADLNLESHKDEIIGKVCTFLRELFPQATIEPDNFYKCILSKAVSKNNCQKDASSIEELCENKGITRNDFVRMLDTYGNSRYSDIRKELETFVQNAPSLGLHDKIVICHDFDRIRKFIFESNRNVLTLYNDCKQQMKALIENQAYSDEHSLFDHISTTFSSTSPLYSKTFFYALSFIVYKDIMRGS